MQILKCYLLQIIKMIKVTELTNVLTRMLQDKGEINKVYEFNSGDFGSDYKNTTGKDVTKLNEQFNVDHFGYVYINYIFIYFNNLI